MRLIYTMAAFLLLPACSSGGGAGVASGADESASSQSGSTSLWERTKSLFTDNSKTVEMSALGLIADSFVNDADARSVQLSAINDIFLTKVDGKNQPIYPRLETLLATDPALKDKKLIARLKSQTVLDVEHVVYATPIIAAIAPRKGWIVNPIKPDPTFDTPFFRNNGRKQDPYDPDLVRAYLMMFTASAIYTNEVFAKIAQQLDGVTLADPDAANERILRAYQSIPIAELKSILKRASADAERPEFNIDLAGSHNIHFVAWPAGDFVADQKGVTWTKSGGIWFGDGKINGRQISFRLASSTSLQQRQSETGTNTQNSDAKVNGSGNVGPGK
jgi:hypothetical protein